MPEREGASVPFAADGHATDTLYELILDECRGPEKFRQPLKDVRCQQMKIIQRQCVARSAILGLLFLGYGVSSI